MQMNEEELAAFLCIYGTQMDQCMYWITSSSIVCMGRISEYDKII